jgi:hypothetical protein
MDFFTVNQRCSINIRMGLSTLSPWNAALEARAVILIKVTRRRKGGIGAVGIRMVGIGEGKIGEGWFEGNCLGFSLTKETSKQQISQCHIQLHC